MTTAPRGSRPGAARRTWPATLPLGTRVRWRRRGRTLAGWRPPVHSAGRSVEAPFTTHGLRTMMPSSTAVASTASGAIALGDRGSAGLGGDHVGSPTADSARADLAKFHLAEHRKDVETELTLVQLTGTRGAAGAARRATERRTPRTSSCQRRGRSRTHARRRCGRGFARKASASRFVRKVVGPVCRTESTQYHAEEFVPTATCARFPTGCDSCSGF